MLARQALSVQNGVLIVLTRNRQRTARNGTDSFVRCTLLLLALRREVENMLAFFTLVNMKDDLY